WSGQGRLLMLWGRGYCTLILPLQPFRTTSFARNYFILDGNDSMNKMGSIIETFRDFFFSATETIYRTFH
ncbi:MAG: hypothetical protein V1899_00975, partial [Planctomycetota bacterium]